MVSVTQLQIINSQAYQLTVQRYDETKVITRTKDSQHIDVGISHGQHINTTIQQME